MSVVFQYPVWIARFPEFADSVGSPLAQSYFDEATLYLNNTGGSAIKNETRRALILNLITAHIAQLNATLNGQASSPLVGRISSATQGSVTVQAELKIDGQGAQWFAQTKYGLAAWQAMASARTARYIPGPPRNINPYSGGFCG